MKRSDINSIMRDADSFIRKQGFYLPPFAYWPPGEWKNKGGECQEIVTNQMGWDITDFGLGDFGKCGLFLFTVRNGNPSNLKTMKGNLYAEKIMVVEVDQVTPRHFHWNKTEDIINRGGGKLVMELHNATEDDRLADTEVTVAMDGVRRTLRAGDRIALSPGESITLPTRAYHAFWGEGERVLVGEISVVNDDTSDNRFYEAVGRFPDIEEDEDPLYLLVTDYPKWTRLAE